MPERSSTLATTLPAAPAPFVLVYPNIVWCERVPLATLVRNLDGGNFAAAFNAREHNHSRAINRNQAPATTFCAEAAANNATSAPPLPLQITLNR